MERKLKKQTMWNARNKSFSRVLHKKENPILIRSAEETDIPRLMAIERAIYQYRLQWTKATFERELRSDIPHLYLVVEWDGEVVGFIGARFYEARGHITNLAIHPEYQRRGLAHLLIQRVERKAKFYHCKKLSLQVRTSNMLAQKLYRSLGFRSRRYLYHYYEDNGENAIYMEKKL